ncbi:MAG: zf-HC2 domain-containing protein [Oscillospiraceae bacterium]|nr:zf-HC2 domain-containing protein [Oscillospiraceae bacterium]
MMQKNCDLIKDLLPLYADEVCSEESRKAVAEHISGCSSCRSMLEKMNKQLVVNVNNDIGTLKRIKRRIWIERIVIGLIAAGVLITGGWLGGFYVFNTEQTMDYEKYNLAENVYAEEDAEGNVWLVKQGLAIESWLIYPTIRDKNGYHSGEEGFDLEEKTGIMITLKERKSNDFVMFNIDSDSRFCQERTMIIEAGSELTEFYYYDDTTDTEYLLWKKGE